MNLSVRKVVRLSTCLGLCLLWNTLSMTAGHDLMIHLAIHHQGPFETEILPARFGVPLPQSSDPIPVDQMVLVGAKAIQIQPVLYWPNGSIRWMLIDAMVGVNPSQDRAVFQLTTGQQEKPQDPIGRMSESMPAMHNGAVIVRAPSATQQAHVLEIEEVSSGAIFKLRFPFPAYLDENTANASWSWEYNGPVACSMILKQPFEWQGASFVRTLRCQLFTGQEEVLVEQVLRRLVLSSSSSQDGVFFQEKDKTWMPASVESAEDWSPMISEDPNMRQWSSSRLQKGFQTKQLQAAELAAQPEDAILLFPGSMARERKAYAFHDLGQTPKSSIAHIGRPVSVNTYHDAQWHGGLLKQGDGSLPWEQPTEPLHLAILSQKVDTLLSGWLLPTPQTMQEMDRLMVGLTQRSPLDSLFMVNDPIGALAAYRLYYGLTGDQSLQSFWVEGMDEIPTEPFRIAPLQALWEACVMTPPQDPSVPWEATAKATQVMEIMQNLPWASMSAQERSGLIPLIHQIWRQGGFPESMQGAWLDRMEVMIHELKSSHPSQELFAIGYLLTGERSFLKEGRQWLDAGEPAPWNRTLEVLVESIQRQWTWRWLPLETSPVEEGIRVEWTVPKGVESYRFKSASQPIESTPSQEAGALAFYQATDRLVSIPLKAEGTTQSVVLPTSELAGDLFVAARYLERGPELPIPKTARDLASAAQDVTEEKSEEGGVDMRRLWMLGVLLLLALLALSAIRKKA